MNKNNIIVQSPTPKVVIKDPETQIIKKVFSFDGCDVLQSYQWQLSTNDISGSFSLSFYPEVLNAKLFDLISILDIVEIYEYKAEQKATGFLTVPVFTGIVRNKKYSTQVTDSGGVKRFSVSGTSISGLVSQFYLNLDTTAIAITKSFANSEKIRKALTDDLSGKPGEEKSLKEVIEVIWNHFLAISEQAGTPKIAEYINSFMGSGTSFFEVDNSLKFYYPLGCVFSGDSTQDFFSVINKIVPAPVYEKFSYTDSIGNTKIKIREVPFDADKWQDLPCTKISATEVKAVDLTESDNEVYTSFFAYLDGYPMEDQVLMRVAIMEEDKLNPTIETSSKKYKTYGYRPLLVHFLGYAVKDDCKEDINTQKILGGLTARIKSWYENVDEMLSGSITLAMNYDNKPIMPGERVSFMDGEFYVEGVSHSWNFGMGGEVNLSLSRGGSYIAGTWQKLKNIGTIVEKVENGTDSPCATYEASSFNANKNVQEKKEPPLLTLNRGGM